jgi:hypothetical protein
LTPPLLFSFSTSSAARAVAIAESPIDARLLRRP